MFPIQGYEGPIGPPGEENVNSFKVLQPDHFVLQGTKERLVILVKTGDQACQVNLKWNKETVLAMNVQSYRGLQLQL